MVNYAKYLMKSLLMTTIFLFLNGSVFFAAQEFKSILTLPGINKVESRGTVPLPVDNSYTPKFSQADSTATAQTDDQEVKLSIIEAEDNNDDSFKGKIAIFEKKEASKTNKSTGSVLYKNMGRYKGKNVNVRLKFSTNSKKLVLGLSNTNALGIYNGLYSDGGIFIDVSYEFLDDQLAPMTISGHWTYYALNILKDIKFSKNQFDKYYAMTSADYQYAMDDSDEKITLGKRDSTTHDNRDNSYLTVTFNNKSKLNYQIECLKPNNTFGVLYASNSICKIVNHEIFAGGKTIRGQYRNEHRQIYQLEPRVPHVDKNAYYKNYQILAPLAAPLEVEASKIKITDENEVDRTNLFDVSISGTNELSIKAKKEGETISNSEFYDHRYTIKIFGKTKDSEKKKDLKLPLQAVLTVDGTPYSSNKAETQFDATTENDLNVKVKRTGQILTFTDVQLEDSTILKRDYQMIEFKLPEKIEPEKLELPDKWFQLKKSDDDQDNIITLSMKGNNSAKQIKTFLEKNISFLDKNAKGVLNKQKIEVIMFSEVITSLQDEEGIRHYYQFVSVDKPAAVNDYTWLHAYNDAKKMNLRGLRGYLATLTSFEEHSFVYDNIAKYSGYFGGTRLLRGSTKQYINDPVSLSTDIGDYSYNDPASDKWYWANGPEAGKIFYDFRTYSDFKADSRPVNEKEIAYNGFRNKENKKLMLPTDDPNEIMENSAEPNDSGKREFVTQFAVSGKWWNDVPHNTMATSNILGYYVEFSEYGDQVETETDENEIQAIATAKIPAPIRQSFKSATNNQELYSLKDYDDGIKIGDRLTLETKTKEHYLIEKPATREVTITDTTQEIIDKYQPKKYTITYDLLGGTSEKELTQTFTIEDKQVTLLSSDGIIKKGHELIKWEAKEVGKDYTLGQVVTSKELGGSLKLSANWEIKEVMMTVYYKLENKNGNLEDLKDLEQELEVKKFKHVEVQVDDPILTHLNPLINQKVKGYLYQRSTLKTLDNELGALMEKIPQHDFEVNMIYTGTLDLEVPLSLTFKPQKLLATKQTRIPLTRLSTIEIINTQGEGSQWKLGVTLAKKMKLKKGLSGDQKLLGQIYYQENALGEPKLISSGSVTDLKKEENPTIINDLLLFTEDQSKGLYLDTFTGNLAGKYEDGEIDWELANVK